MRKLQVWTAGLLLPTWLGIGLAVGPAGAQTSSRYFPETGHSIAGPFRAYWESHGGLAQQGYPLTDEIPERSDTDGQVYTVQYFERGVFEKHPENASPYDVLLSLLGTFEYGRHYGPDAPGQRPSTDNAQSFPQTGHALGGKFRAYWESHGGLYQQGYPISDEFQERSPLDGQVYTVQYFQRAVFELHPENAGTPYEVLLSQLGTFRYRARYAAPPTAGPTAPVTPTGAPPSATATTMALPSAPATPAATTSATPSPVPTRAGRVLDLPTPGPGHVHYSVAASDNFLVWVDSSATAVPTDANLLGLDLETAAPFTVTDAPGNQLNPAISGTRVVWEDWLPGCGYDCPTQILSKELATGRAFVVAGGPGYRRDPVIAGPWVAWVETDHTGIGGTILLKNLDTGNTTTVDTRGSSSWFSRLAISEEYLAWTSYASGAHGGQPAQGPLQVYDLHTGVQRTLADLTDARQGGTFALAGRLLAWEDGPIYLSDLAAETRVTISATGGTVNAIRDSTVIWTGAQADLQGDQHLWGWRAGTQSPVRLRLGPGTQRDARIAGPWLEWTQADGPVSHLAGLALADAFALSATP